MVVVSERIFGLLLTLNTEDIILGKTRQVTVLTRVSNIPSTKLIFRSPYAKNPHLLLWNKIGIIQSVSTF